MKGHTVALFLLICLLTGTLAAQDAPSTSPHIDKRDGHFAMMVDGKPFLMLGSQINNSSSWASSLPDVWPALQAMHVNTVEAPVYWEQMEPAQGKFDFSNVDLLVNGAREHGLRLVILWFGTWKNGQAHYVPEWIKSDPQKYPREVNAYGKLLDVMSPNSTNNLEADKHAFSALMQHVHQIDATQHTVIMIQVENESGSVGAVRDYSAAANKEFAEQVPSSLTKALHLSSGTWSQVFGADADERFAAYSTAKYINEVAQAGKSEHAVPMYCNVWITYPVHALENRDHASAGQEYPSGGPQQGNIAIWKAAAPSIDVLAPDFYSSDAALFRDVLSAYHRDDNPIFIPETGLGKTFGRYFFYALGRGAIGFSPFGVDYTNWTISDRTIPFSMADNFALFAPMTEEIARLNFEGKVQTTVEEKGAARQTLHFGDVNAIVSFGFPQRDGEEPPGTADQQGRAMVAQLGPYEFLVTGFDASVSFQLAPPTSHSMQDKQIEILQADEGQYIHGTWQTARIWNGDQTDRGLNFKEHNTSVIRIRLHTLPLHEKSAEDRN
ncbi:DUF5597 domain-containing protein [Granulicella arctica]|uniref:Beta-galactosidase n=1 Tax=Granulicella arctica TaxID=940613 RepID=A0A7Y9PFG9_9BACT|nr:DUF5597 domain-containing protein [Granulicella arctica]NYF78968.1 hypothetical protein [Granulicella arctica]